MRTWVSTLEATPAGWRVGDGRRELMLADYVVIAHNGKCAMALGPGPPGGG